jgi:hypothetical protein
LVLALRQLKQSWILAQAQAPLLPQAQAQEQFPELAPQAQELQLEQQAQERVPQLEPLALGLGQEPRLEPQAQERVREPEQGLPPLGLGLELLAQELPVGH